MVNIRAVKSLLLVPILSTMNAFHNVISGFCKICFQYYPPIYSKSSLVKIGRKAVENGRTWTRRNVDHEANFVFNPYRTNVENRVSS